MPPPSSSEAVVIVSENNENTALNMCLSQEDEMYTAIDQHHQEPVEVVAHTLAALAVEREDDAYKTSPVSQLAPNHSIQILDLPRSVTSTPALSSSSGESDDSFTTTVMSASGEVGGTSTISRCRPSRAKDEQGDSHEERKRKREDKYGPPADLVDTIARLNKQSRARRPRQPLPNYAGVRPSTAIPCSLFAPKQKFVGTQKSDPQKTYLVEVEILTVDMPNSSMSGTLTIKHLTPEHDILQTFFTGEIIGGRTTRAEQEHTLRSAEIIPQHYSFQTKDPTWSANDRIDMQHWIRFPPWRKYIERAKKDMDFSFPLFGDGAWWEQEHVFMRWKEHFLVPDHKCTNIHGASFEGFYYISFSQLEGKISGVYFHAKSDKWQQLELVHTSRLDNDKWAPAYLPAVELA